MGTIPASITGIPHPAFLDSDCSHIAWTTGTPLEAIQMATRQDKTIPCFIGMSPFSITIANDYPTIGIIKHPGLAQVS